MYLPPALLLLLLAQEAPTALAFAPHRSLVTATERFHKYAKRRSSRLARDLRVVFQGLSVDQADSDPNDSHRVYCVRPDDLSGLKGNVSSTSPATSHSGSAFATATGSGTAVPSATATSAYKLVESHVRPFTIHTFH